MAGMTAAHNAVRDALVGEGLPQLTWSDTLADVAQAFAELLAADGCAFYHSGGDYGENLAMFGGQDATAQQVVDLWESEQPCYTYGRFMMGDVCTDNCDADGQCGHYTQLVWRATLQVGCGVADCSGGFWEIWVCNYSPAGNVVGQYPY